MLNEIKGLGKKTIEILEEAGIDTIKKLANSEVKDLSELKGIGKKSAEKYIEGAKALLEEKGEELGEEQEVVGEEEAKEKGEETEEEEPEEIEEITYEPSEEKKERLEGNSVEEGDFIILKITGKTERGQVFRVSSIEDAKKANIYDEEDAKKGEYRPEFVVVGKPGFLNEGLTEVVENMNYFEKKSVRIPPRKAFGRRDPQKLERMGIGRYRRLNDGKYPELGQEFIKKSKQGQPQRGRVIRIAQGRVLVDYNHPLAGQSIDYNIEILDKIEDFDDQIKHFIISKGIPQENISDFEINYIEEDKTVEITIPKSFLFQNLTYLKFGLAMDLQTHLTDKVEDVKFIEIYEKMPAPESPEQSVKKKIEQYSEDVEPGSELDLDTETNISPEELETEKEE
ncbi:MAG: Peptidylprolyl isomerase [Promethearchaeota archaeon]|nr:MAG: Peptidylprolyl isomerase [Candidatus Lokiarchaeota archaeon]